MTTADAQELLRRLQDAVEVEQKITEIRPRRDVLGRCLQGYADLLQLAVRRAVNGQAIAAVQVGIRAGNFDESEFDQFAWRPASDSSACTERESLIAAGVSLEAQQHERHQDYSRTVSVARRLTEALIDNLRGIALLLQDSEVTRGPMALSRVVLDAAAHVCFLLAHDVSPAERMRRTLNEELSLLVDDYKAAKAASDVQAIADRENEFAGLRQIAESCGFRDFASTLAYDRQGRVITSVKPSDSTSRMIDLALDNPGPFWHELSAIVHSQEGMGIRLLLGLESSEPPRRRDRYVAFHVLPAVLIATQVNPLLSTYMGWDFSDLTESEELLLQLWAHGSGMRDEQYRAQVADSG